MQGRDVAVVVAVIVIVVLLLGLLGAGMMGFGWMGPGMMGGYYGSRYAPWMGLLMLLFWALVIGGVVLLVVWLVRQGGVVTSGGTAREGTALEILKQRYARGEITKEQFEQMRRDLE